MAPEADGGTRRTDPGRGQEISSPGGEDPAPSRGQYQHDQRRKRPAGDRREQDDDGHGNDHADQQPGQQPKGAGEQLWSGGPAGEFWGPVEAPRTSRPERPPST